MFSIPVSATSSSKTTTENPVDNLSAIILDVPNKNDREQIANYFFSPAYEKYEILDDAESFTISESFESLNSTEKIFNWKMKPVN